MNARLRRAAVGSMMVIVAGLGVTGCGGPDYTVEDVETCGVILGKDAPVETEISVAEFWLQGEIREHGVTKYYIVTREHGQVEVDFESYAMNEKGDTYCTTESVRVPNGDG